MLTTITLVGHTQKVRNQAQINSNHTCKVINACHNINAHEHNEPNENEDRVKSCQMKKYPKKRMRKKSC